MISAFHHFWRAMIEANNKIFLEGESSILIGFFVISYLLQTYNASDI